MKHTIQPKRTYITVYLDESPDSDYLQLDTTDITDCMNELSFTEEEAVQYMVDQYLNDIKN